MGRQARGGNGGGSAAVGGTGGGEAGQLHRAASLALNAPLCSSGASCGVQRAASSLLPPGMDGRRLLPGPLLQDLRSMHSCPQQRGAQARSASHAAPRDGAQEAPGVTHRSVSPHRSFQEAEAGAAEPLGPLVLRSAPPQQRPLCMQPSIGPVLAALP